VIGIVASAGVAVFARCVGLDRDRAFYPTVVIVVALYCVLFAVMSGSVRTVLLEFVVMSLFAAAAAVGFKSSAWIVVAALAGHGIFDAVHGHIIENALPPLGAGLVFWCDVGTAAWLRSCTKRGGAASGRSAPSRRIRTATGDSECESRSMQLGADFVGRRVHRDDTAAVPCCRGAGGFKLRRDGTPLPDIERFNRVCGRSDLFTYGCDFDKPPAQRRLTWEAPERRR
jgi:hypothetical protein